MEYRFLQKKDNTYFIQRKITLFHRGFWFALRNIKSFFGWYFFGVAFQFAFGILMGYILHLSKSNYHTLDLITSNSYFIISWIVPIYSPLRNTKITIHIQIYKDKFSFFINEPFLFHKFCDIYSNIVNKDDSDGGFVQIDIKNLFPVEKQTVSGKSKTIYHLGIKQLRKEKLEKLFFK